MIRRLENMRRAPGAWAITREAFAFSVVSALEWGLPEVGVNVNRFLWHPDVLGEKDSAAVNKAAGPISIEWARKVVETALNLIRIAEGGFDFSPPPRLTCPDCYGDLVFTGYNVDATLVFLNCVNCASCFCANENADELI